MPVTLPFVWGPGGSKVTPEALAQQQKVVDALMASGERLPTNFWEGAKGFTDTLVGNTLQDRHDQALAKAQGDFTQQYDALGQTPSRSQLEALAGNEFANPGQAAVVKALLAQDFQQSDPANQLDLKYKQAQYDNLTNPKTWSQLTPEEVTASGLDPSMDWQRSPEGKVEPVDAGKTPAAGYTLDENGNVIDGGDFSTLDIGRFNLASNRATKVFRDSMAFKSAQNAGFYLAKLKAAEQGGSINDQEILDSISQFNTGGGRVTEAQVNIILHGRSLGDTVNTWYNQMKNGGVLSDEQRHRALALAKATADEFLKNYEDKYKPLAANLIKQRIPQEFWGVPTPDQLRAEYGGDPATGGDLPPGVTEEDVQYTLQLHPEMTRADVIKAASNGS